MTLVYLDTETTGLDPAVHQVWEIGYAVDDGPIVSGFVRHDPPTLDYASLQAALVNGYVGRYGPYTTAPEGPPARLDSQPGEALRFVQPEPGHGVRLDVEQPVTPRGGSPAGSQEGGVEGWVGSDEGRVAERLHELVPHSGRRRAHPARGAPGAATALRAQRVEVALVNLWVILGLLIVDLALTIGVLVFQIALEHNIQRIERRMRAFDRDLDVMDRELDDHVERLDAVDEQLSNERRITALFDGHTTTRARRAAAEMTELHLVPVTFDKASDFVALWHRHHGRPAGHKFSIGVASSAGVLHGVIIVGRPGPRAFDDGSTLEVIRSATDGASNANSMLYAAAWRAAKALGYRRLVTYTQQGESGSSLRAAGWRVIAERPARSGWTTPSRPRHDRGVDGIPRTLWEAS